MAGLARPGPAVAHTFTDGHAAAHPLSAPGVYAAAHGHAAARHGHTPAGHGAAPARGHAGSLGDTHADTAQALARTDADPVALADADGHPDAHTVA